VDDALRAVSIALRTDERRTRRELIKQGFLTCDPCAAVRREIAWSEILDRAFRLRAGEIGALQSCLCDYPIRHHDTVSHHDERCPAHAIRLSMIAAEAKR
jgi:hypothetical protein